MKLCHIFGILRNVSILITFQYCRWLRSSEFLNDFFRMKVFNNRNDAHLSLQAERFLILSFLNKSDSMDIMLLKYDRVALKCPGHKSNYTCT